MYLKKIATIAMCITFIACERDSSDVEKFDIGNMLVSVHQENIIPNTNTFVIQSENLVNAAEALLSENNLNSFENFRNAWYETMERWQKVQVVNFGALSKKYYDVSISNWPANAFFIDQILTGNDEINQIYIDGKGGSSKGLPGIEYICFDKNKTAAEIFPSLTERQRHYILAVSQNNLKYAKLIESYWLENSNTFVNASNNGINGSVTLMVNQIVHLIDDFGKNKIGRQAGLYNTTEKNPKDTECYRSEYSYECLHYGTQSLQDFFKGSSKNISNLPGIDDYLNQVQGDEILSLEINQQFEHIYALIENSNASLADDIEQDAARVHELYESYKTLGLLFKTDVASLLSITIVPSDSDGD